MATITTSAGIGDYYPRSALGILLVTILMIATKFIVAVYIGDISAIVQNYSYTLVNYDHGMLKLKVGSRGMQSVKGATVLVFGGRSI